MPPLAQATAAGPVSTSAAGRAASPLSNQARMRPAAA